MEYDEFMQGFIFGVGVHQHLGGLDFDLAGRLTDIANGAVSLVATPEEAIAAYERGTGHPMSEDSKERLRRELGANRGAVDTKNREMAKRVLRVLGDHRMK
jgi:hypothetical protein